MLCGSSIVSVAFSKPFIMKTSTKLLHFDGIRGHGRTKYIYIYMMHYPLLLTCVNYTQTVCVCLDTSARAVNVHTTHTLVIKRVSERVQYARDFVNRLIKKRDTLQRGVRVVVIHIYIRILSI